MKLYTSVGPNPRVVTMFVAEKGIDLPTETVDIRAGVNRQSDFLKVNPTGTSPALQLDDGAVISEITAICEYLEEKHPSPALIGTTAEERAETRMWTRRADLKVCEPMTSGFRYSEGLKMFNDRMRCLPEAADGLKAVARDGMAWFDGQLAGRQWLCGDRFTLADIHLFAFLDFGGMVKQPVPEECKNLAAWYGRVKERPSAQAK